MGRSKFHYSKGRAQFEVREIVGRAYEWVFKDLAGVEGLGRGFALKSRMKNAQVEVSGIESKIYVICGLKVMLDFDLAELYQVPTMRLNEQVKRNSRRFPSDFMFHLSDQEFENLISQFAISSLGWGGRRRPPLAFTEQGIAMLSSVLRSERSIDVNVAIMRIFVQMRKILISNKDLEIRLNELEAKYERHDGELKLVFDAIRKLMSIRAIPHKRVVGLGEDE